MLPMLLSFALLADPCVSQDTASETVSTVQAPNTVMISEAYPDPEDGEQEFFELKNTGSAPVDLTGWNVMDASGKDFTLSGTLDDFKALYQEETKIYLNNDTETLSLIKPDGTTLQTLSIPESEKGKSYGYDETTWGWMETTPGEENKNIETQIIDIEDDNTDNENEDENLASGNEDAEIQYDLSDELLINELLPDALGVDTEDEFIEIFNPSEKDVRLAGWQLTDEDNYFTFGEEVLKADAYTPVYYPETKISLNNDGDKLYLIDPEGKIINGVEYEGSENGKSWSRFDAAWAWADPTPGEENVETPIEVIEDDGGDEDNAEDTGIMSISDVKELEKGTVVTVEGAVTVVPGILSTQSFYIQDDEAGIQIYSSRKDFPDLQEGDWVQITGETSEAYGEKRINTSTAADVLVQDSGKNVDPIFVEAIGEESEGLLVEARGEIIDKSGSYLTLDNEILIYVKSGTNIDVGEFEEGNVVSVTGIVSEYNEKYRILPRSLDDLQKEEAMAFTTEESIIAQAKEKHDLASSSGSQEKSILRILMSIVFASTLIIFWFIREKIKAKNMNRTQM